MTNQQTQQLIKDLVSLAVELGASGKSIFNLLLGNGYTIEELYFYGFIDDEGTLITGETK